ncbi:ABC transporter ATP-binding protein [Thalassotalea sp. ND16A]|uniref:ABC transporter ATP-binding protein n=1 Tax=Thalassotalea sp. ND16A TaxID=1535422 RepID=UPI00051D0F31|nr:ABC transporter ATP-binding protein [Thalassotalea sp. ND16A]KGJ89487.1 Phosphonate-transporting ATPase [Thalassotalea sp. ND16A]
MSAIIDIKQLKYSWSENSDFEFHIDDFNVHKGERLFLRGPSGSGKTTLLSLLCGIISADSGSLNILGENLTTMKAGKRDQFRADHIGVIFQMFNLIPYLTTIENVVLSCHFSTLRKQRALTNSATLETEAIRLLAHLDMSDENLLHKRVNELSIGQQQRVAAARALMGAPEIIVADEPTSSLDADRCHSFLELLFKECEAAGSTLIFVSHDLRLKVEFERSVLLNRQSYDNSNDKNNGKAVVSLFAEGGA